MKIYKEVKGKVNGPYENELLKKLGYIENVSSRWYGGGFPSYKLSKK